MPRFSQDQDHPETYRWQSTADFAADFIDKGFGVGKDYDGSWSGEDRGVALRRCVTGDATNLEAAREMLGVVQLSVELDKRMWQRGVVGCIPDVAAFIAGHPENMMYRDNVPSQSTPMRIFVCNTSSGNIDHETLTKRGIVILSLVLALQERRSVELYVFTGLDSGTSKRGDYWAIIKVQTDLLSEVAWALTSQALPRSLMYKWGMRQTPPDSSGAWPRSIASTVNNYSKMDETTAACRIAVGAEPQDLVIPPVHTQDELSREPVKWLNEQVLRYTDQLEGI